MEKHGTRTQPYALKPGDGWIYRYGVKFAVKAGEVQDGSGAAMVEYTIKHGEEPPPHTHETEDEMFYILEGALTFRCGEEQFELEQGGFVFLPRGIEHCYTAPDKIAVRVLVVTAPVRDGSSGGWGGFVADMEAGDGELVSKPGDASSTKNTKDHEEKRNEK